MIPVSGLLTPSKALNPDTNPAIELLFTQRVGAIVGVSGVRFALLPRARPYVRVSVRRKPKLTPLTPVTPTIPQVVFTNREVR
jgi:hypothetical protein